MEKDVGAVFAFAWSLYGKYPFALALYSISQT
jgi:hypothetical protein